MAITLPVSETTWVFATLVFVAIVIGLAVAWLPHLTAWDFTATPSGPLFYAPQDIKAMQSTEAVTCAINSVAGKSEYKEGVCEKYFEKDSGSSGTVTGHFLSEFIERLKLSAIAGQVGKVTGFFSWPGSPGTDGITGNAIWANDPNAERANVLCRRVQFYYYCADYCTIGDEYVETLKTSGKCEQKKIDLTTAGYMEKTEHASIECDSKDNIKKCTVKNFELDQKFQEKEIYGATFTPEEWIAGYGDPEYLIYYQQFPLGEDTAWSGTLTWVQNAVTVVMFMVPFGRTLKFGNTAWRTTTKGISSIPFIGKTFKKL